MLSVSEKLNSLLKGVENWLQLPPKLEYKKHEMAVVDKTLIKIW